MQSIWIRMMMPKSWAVGGLLIGSAFFPAEANASEACAQMYDQFAAEQTRLATAYEHMTNIRDVCTYDRSAAIPLQKRILAAIEASLGRCATAPAAVKEARKELQDVLKKTADDCRQAGM